MLYDLVAILLIIGFSFLFKISITKGYDEQLIFILLSLVIMVIYKYLTYRHMMRRHTVHNNMASLGFAEPYTDFSSEVNDFLGQEIPSGINQGNINEYKSKLAALSEKVDIMNEYLKDLSTKASMDGQDNKAAIGGLDFQAGQQIQDYRIRKIQEDIQRTSDLIKQNRLAEDAKKFNKIKVFSSCIVAGADGSYSKDTAAASSGSSITPGNGSMPAGITSSMLAASGSSLSVPSAAPASAAGSGLGAGSGIDWQTLLNSIANNGVNINLT